VGWLQIALVVPESFDAKLPYLFCLVEAGIEMEIEKGGFRLLFYL